MKPRYTPDNSAGHDEGFDFISLAEIEGCYSASEESNDLAQFLSLSEFTPFCVSFMGDGDSLPPNVLNS